MSLAYNNLIGVNLGGTFKSPSLRQAIVNDNRAEAWYEIRYNSNGGASSGSGIANRRIAESNLFSLYDNPGQGVSEAEAKEVLRMYTTHQADIQVYETRFPTQFVQGGTDTIQFQITGAKTTLIPLYAEGRTIDGEVLVGQDAAPALTVFETLKGTSKGDLLMGEGGIDQLEGGSGTDVLYGGEGADTLLGDTEADLLIGGSGIDWLQGGAGDDRLEGGVGFDTYYYTTGDGNDRIEDSDATGMILVNGQMLSGGVKKSGHTDWVSADGTIKYRMSGTDLVVELNGQQILTVNENFQSGQFGIRPMDRSVRMEAVWAMKRSAA